MNKATTLLKLAVLLGAWSLGSLPGRGQPAYTLVSLDNLSFFKSPAANWRLASDVQVSPRVQGDFRPVTGTGVLVNTPADVHEDLFSAEEFGDLDLEFEFMMAPGSNSGVYLQGRYEIQLLDSWGKKNPGFGDCGGIYERWNDQKPDGQKGYQGVAPRENACKAPGLWQKMLISFQAPKFDAKGNKTANARILRIELNGVVLHENVELTGPTRGAMSADEKAMGPLRIQGDHGAVAFRHIKYAHYNRPPVTLTNLTYSLYPRETVDIPALESLKPESQGTLSALSWEVPGLPERFILRIMGVLEVPVAGTYQIEHIGFGSSRLMVDGKQLDAWSWFSNTVSAELSAGPHQIELAYAKYDTWYAPGLGLIVSGPGLRAQSLHTLSSIVLPNPASAIAAPLGYEPYILRCFVDVNAPREEAHRVVHAINVGTPGKAHYTFNADNGALVQAWRGGFMDATPMWHDRGDGSARPVGAVLRMSDKPAIQPLTDMNAPFPALLSQDAWRFQGYRLDEAGYPIFTYQVHGATVSDRFIPGEDGKSLTRELTISGGQGLYLCLARGTDIQPVGKPKDQLYAVDGRSWYLQLPPKTTPVIRRVAEATLAFKNGQPALAAGTQDQVQELLLPASGVIRYTVMW
ncbi:MAG: family 16 glycoside hydrolase [Bacteroidia bacterium]|nr:family 16 glycoside hydrolase [Bacteroidia bacterium]